MKNQVFYLFLSKLFFFILVLTSSEQLAGQNITAIGPPIDFSAGNEYDPAFSNDGKLLAFVSDKSGQYKIYLSRNMGDSWSEPEEISEINNFNNGEGNIRYPSFNYDGSVLYFSADFEKDSLNVEIYYSKKTNNTWSEPINIGFPVNSKNYDGQPSISADNNSLFFTRNVNDSKLDDVDCKSIFLSTKNSDGEWQNPEELPIPINTGCEQCPKIGIDNKTLYFTSTRDGGKGGFDVYKSRLIAKNVWVPAESIDTLNTENNDFTPSFFFNSDQAYFTIEQADKKLKMSKIYKCTIPPQFLPAQNARLVGTINELSSKKPIDAQIIVSDPVTSSIISKYTNDPENGKYELYLPRGNNYQIDFHKKDYSHSFILIEAKDLKSNKDITRNISLYNTIKLILNVFDQEIFRPIDAQIEIRNSKDEIIDAPIEKVQNGRYTIDIPLGEKYKFLLKANYYETHSFDFDLTGIVQFDEFEKDAELIANKVDFIIAVSDEATQSGLPVEVIITNLDNNEVIRTTATAGSDGKYTIKLRDGDKYSVSVSPKGYSFYNTTVDLKKKQAPKKLDVKLKQLKEDTKLTLNDITFEINSADLNESSYEELNRVVKLMNDNPDINIEISAHTDNLGSDAYNLRLSKRRASSVEAYLLEQNVSKNRLISIGYGESKPQYPNDTDEHKALNRRVELKIIKIQ
ncbi:MAG: OmpA family protein [Bacteroidales bacterium]|nr:OmpA family protein [Bacteroidales bacterium]